ncbi:2-hydroxy-3-oxopropionate reductase [Microtetraspora sp. NBRC 13810]|uniref:NAD(P)-dependent oxidoreductase n=1 Tax=Microtetraspora sp. NBRC 13810 TaxID=3030990 RepID=UPI0024A53AEC|nr:NAD(P)-dependent oxidoreductase [Microtetraspora sp. NBRC 13810]GLW06665.1 2-hydroxy-3-oxopropionate reductase [Microtetraspora sp. NBRC 13810]
MSDVAPVVPGAAVGFIGLGHMGSPMARRLVAAGYAVRGFDANPAARPEGVAAARSATAAVTGAAAVVLMLPDSAAVESVLTPGLLERLAPGTPIVDMGSSEPARTRALAEQAAKLGVPLVDAPVSGGVRGAERGTLTVMAGGDPEAVAALRPLFGVLGTRVLHVGPVGAGHALKALNNLLSATHLLVSSEAVLAGREFGLDPQVMLEAINGSSGRSGSTEDKWPRFMLNRRFDSGFGVGLLLKDLRIAAGLARDAGRPCLLGEAAVELWARAAAELPAGADHTEIVRWLELRHDEKGD